MLEELSKVSKIITFLVILTFFVLILSIFYNNSELFLEQRISKFNQKTYGIQEIFNDTDIAEAETLTVTAKQKQRQALEDEVAAFLARGGRITEVPPDEHSDH